MKRHTLIVSGAVVSLTAVLALVTPPHGDAATVYTYKVPASAGQMLASNCYQCHGTNGLSGAIDQLAGDGAADTYAKLKDQQTKSTIMGAQARGFTNAELQAIADYFASLPKP